MSTISEKLLLLKDDIDAVYAKGQSEGLAVTNDATAVAGDMLSGTTAYVKGVKVTGNMTNQGAKTATLNTSTTSYTIPAGYHNGSGKVSIATETKSATPTTSAQDITPSSGKVLSKVTVGAISTQTKSATPNVTSQDITPDNGKYLTKVTVGAIPNQKTANDVTVSGATVTIPAGYYNGKVEKTIADATFGPPGYDKDANDNSYDIFINSEGGYVQEGRIQLGTLTVPFATQTISYSINSSTGVVTGTITNAKEGYVYGPGAMATYSLPTVSAGTITPGTSNKTAVAAGKYTTGAVTVAGSSNLVASNIKSGVSIFGVQGTYTGPTYNDAESEEW